MKYLLLALIVPAFILTSCTKENIVINEDSETSVYNRAMIVGKWNVKDVTTKVFDGQTLASNTTEVFGEGNNEKKNEMMFQSNGDYAQFEFDASEPSPETYYANCDYYSVKENILYISTLFSFDGYINELNANSFTFTMVEADGNKQTHKIYRLTKSTDTYSVTH